MFHMEQILAFPMEHCSLWNVGQNVVQKNPITESHSLFQHTSYSLGTWATNNPTQHLMCNLSFIKPVALFPKEVGSPLHCFHL